MSFLHEPPMDRSSSHGERPDELDGLLREFFRAEMPNPWPDLAPPEQRAVLTFAPPMRSRTSVRSRLALAASVGLLLTGSLLLPLTKNPGDSPALHGTVIGDRDSGLPFTPLKNSKVRTPDGEEFEMKEFLRHGKDGPEIRIDFDRR